MNELMFYGGITAIGILVVIGILAAILLRIQYKKIEKQLDEDYGKE